MKREPFGTMADGSPVEIFTLRNARGIELRAIGFGGIVTSLKTPDRTGRFEDIVLGYERLNDYLQRNSRFFGAIVGRYANRIAKGRFALDGRTYTLATNNGANHLHGGTRGFDKHPWKVEPVPGRNALSFTRTSPDGEESYPGNLRVQVTYALTDRDELVIEYRASTDKPTIVNLTQHSYFNLAGHAAGDVLGHEVTLNADRYTPVDEGLIPTGELEPVAGTPFDFRTSMAIGARVEDAHAQLKHARGYDHNWVLNRTGMGLELAARVVEPGSGRTLEVRTTEPGIQFYSGNFLDGTLVGKEGVAYRHRTGFCVETQHFPDSPNQPKFPSATLRPGSEYRTTTVFTFGVDDGPSPDR